MTTIGKHGIILVIFEYILFKQIPRRSVEVDSIVTRIKRARRTNNGHWHSDAYLMEAVMPNGLSILGVLHTDIYKIIQMPLFPVCTFTKIACN